MDVGWELTGDFVGNEEVAEDWMVRWSWLE
jgi:hypothetical protein